MMFKHWLVLYIVHVVYPTHNIFLYQIYMYIQTSPVHILNNIKLYTGFQLIDTWTHI